MFAKFYRLLVRNNFYKGIFIIGPNFKSQDVKISSYFPCNVFYIESSLSKKNEVVSVNIYNDPSFNSECPFNKNRGDYKHLVFLEKKEVSAILLDDINNTLDFNFCFIDTNGTELKVLQGGEKFLEKIEYLCVRVHYSNLFEGHTNHKELLRYLSERGWYLRDSYVKDSDHVYIYFSRLLPPSKYYATVELNGNLGNQLFQLFFIYGYAKRHNLQLVFSDIPYYPNFNGLIDSPILKFFNNCNEVQVMSYDEFDKISFHQIVTGSIPEQNGNSPPLFQNIKYVGHFENHLLSEDVRIELINEMKKEIPYSSKIMTELNRKAIKLLLQRNVSIGEYLEYKFCAMHICLEISGVLYNADLEYYRNAIQSMSKMFKNSQLPIQLIFVIIVVQDAYIQDKELEEKIKKELEQELFIELRIDCEYEALYALSGFDAYILNNSNLDYIGWYLNNEYKNIPMIRPRKK